MWCPHIALLFAAPITVWRSKWIEVRYVVSSTNKAKQQPHWPLHFCHHYNWKFQICNTFLFVSLFLFIYYLNFPIYVCMSFSSHSMNRNVWRGPACSLFCLLGLLSFWTSFVSLRALASEKAKNSILYP